MTDHMPKWGNGRPEFLSDQEARELHREGFESNPPLRLRLVKSKHEFKSAEHLDMYFDFANEKEKRRVWDLHNRLGEVSFTMKYENAKEDVSERVVTPLALTLCNGRWGFFAICELRDAVRWFRFDRIKGMDPLPVVRRLHPQELSLRLLSMGDKERQCILDALSILDPELAEKLRGDNRRPAYGGDRNYSRTTKKAAVKRKPTEPFRNPEGLTWAEWAAAAGIPHRPRGQGHTREQHTAYREEWRDGVDPTEIRAQPTLRERMREEQNKRGSLTQMGRKRRLKQS